MLRVKKHNKTHICLGYKSCSRCKCRYKRHCYSIKEWMNSDRRRVCIKWSWKQFCRSCKTWKSKSTFHSTQWSVIKEKGTSICLQCVRKRHRINNEQIKCDDCKQFGAMFKHPLKVKGQRLKNKKCWLCLYLEKQRKQQRCYRCKTIVTVNELCMVTSASSAHSKLLCIPCTHLHRRTIGMWTCMNKQCKLQKPIEEFNITRAKHGDNCKGNNRICNDCITTKTIKKEITQKIQTNCQEKNIILNKLNK